MTYPASNDDASIDDGTWVWRGVPPDQIFEDEGRGRRPSSLVFSDNSNGDPMSVFIEAECGGVEEVLKHLPRGLLIVRFTVGLARICGQGVVRDPGHGGPGHAVVVGNKKLKVDFQGRRLMARQVLAHECEWVLGPG